MIQLDIFAIDCLPKLPEHLSMFETREKVLELLLTWDLNIVSYSPAEQMTPSRCSIFKSKTLSNNICCSCNFCIPWNARFDGLTHTRHVFMLGNFFSLSLLSNRLLWALLRNILWCFMCSLLTHCLRTRWTWGVIVVHCPSVSVIWWHRLRSHKKFPWLLRKRKAVQGTDSGSNEGESHYSLTAHSYSFVWC